MPRIETNLPHSVQRILHGENCFRREAFRAKVTVEKLVIRTFVSVKGPGKSVHYFVLKAGESLILKGPKRGVYYPTTVINWDGTVIHENT